MDYFTVRRGAKTTILPEAAKLLTFLLLLTLPTAVQSQDFTYTTNNGAITITQYIGSNSVVTIPTTIDGFPVTSIGDWAFFDWAFWRTDSPLTSIIISTNITSIGIGAFSSTDLTDITIPDSVINIGSKAFAYCSSLTSVTIPNNVTSLGDWAFACCTNMTNIIIGNNTTHIGIGVFYNCTSLENVVVPNSVTSIGERAFECTDLTNVAIGSSVTNVGDQAFKSCPKLTAITVDPLNSVYSTLDGVLFDKSQTILIKYPNGKAGYQYTIPSSVTNIGSRAFEDCTELTRIDFQGNPPSLGDSVFDGAYRDWNWVTIYYLPGTTGWGPTFGERPAILWDPLLPYKYTTNSGTITITGFTGTNSIAIIPSTINGLPVTSIADSAFRSCTILTSVTIPNSVANIRDYTFAGCAGLTSVTIPNSITNIGDYAFARCGGLTSVSIPEGVQRIGNSAFDACTSLTSITIPSSVNSIGIGPFVSCTRMTAIMVDKLNSAYSSVNGVLFNKKKTTLLQYPAGKTESSYAIPNSVIRIGESAFTSCLYLTNVTVPKNVKSIGDRAFWDCRKLVEFYFQGNAPKTGSDVFCYFSDATVYCLSGTTGWSTFVGLPARLQSSGYVCLINEGTVSIESYFGTVSALSIPDKINGLSVASISDGAFARCTNLTSVIIPNSVTNIGDEAFYQCPNLTKVTISSNSVISDTNDAISGIFPRVPRVPQVIRNSSVHIGDGAFSDCPKLASIIIPGSVKSIGYGAFASNYRLASITIPKGVTNIGEFAFTDCTMLSSIHIPESVTTIGLFAFHYCTNLSSITVAASNPMYSSVNGVLFNKNRTMLIRYPEGRNRQDYTIPNGVITIEIEAFASCKNLIQVTIPESVTTIRGFAFYDCTHLTGAYFQGNAPSFDNAFVGDSDLIVYYPPRTTGWNPIMSDCPALLFDLQKPTLTMVSPKAGSCFRNDGYSVTATGSTEDNDAISHVFFRVNDGTWTHATTTNTWTNWSASFPVNPGTNTLQAYAVDTSTNYSSTTKVSFVYAPLAPLCITNTGLGTLKPAFTNGQLLVLGGSYSVTATGTDGYVFSNWTGYACETKVLNFTMLSNTVLSANFVPNPFTAIAGEYRGLFYDEAGITGTSSGAFSATVKNNGGYTGKLIQGTASYPLSGRLQFSLGGLATNTVKINNTNLTVILRLTSDNGGEIKGSVASSAWTTMLDAVRNPYSKSNKASVGGLYTMAVPGSTYSGSLPAGYSTASLDVSPLGTVTLKGYAADGNAFTRSTVLSQEGRWPLYIPLTGGGILMGWETLSRTGSSTIDGWATWLKPSGSKLYPEGFHYQTTNVFGSVYSNQIPSLRSSNGTLTLTDGNLPSALTNALLILQPVTDVTKTNKLKMTLTPASGLFRGSFANPETKRAVNYNGALFQEQNSGLGAFRGTNQTGWLFLTTE